MKIAQISSALVFVVFALAGAKLINAAYMGHHDTDSPNIIKAYPEIKNTELDSCGMCHVNGAGMIPGDSSGKTMSMNSCDYCHYATDYGAKPANGTLNLFGRAYLNAGRDAAALEKIAAKDSDGDGAANSDEIKAMSNPGDPDHSPADTPAAHKIISLAEMKEMNLRTFGGTIFMNVSKSKEGDSYSDYNGFYLIDILKAAGMATGTTSIDVISIDGYERTFSIDQISRMYSQAVPVYGLDKGTLGDCGWVTYRGVTADGAESLPDAGFIISTQRNGRDNEPGKIDPETGKLSGDGPFRVIGPQMFNPGPPDVSRYATPECIAKVPEIYHYHRDYEKNSDYCIKATVAIRVNRVPAGMKDYPWRTNAEKLIAGSEIVIFGNIR